MTSIPFPAAEADRRRRARDDPDLLRHQLRLELRQREGGPARPLREGQARPVERHDAARLGHRTSIPRARSSRRRSIRSPDYAPFKKLDAKERARLRHAQISLQLSQFLHGEQGALIVASQLVGGVPWIDAKYYAGTQTMDEARHVEVFSRYLREKLEWEWPINASLKELLDATIKDSRWDFKYLGMQIIIEGLAMAAFGNLYQLAQEPLLKELLQYVMKDESRHVAFGVLSLRDYYTDMPANELRDREDFIIYACELMRNRLVGDEIARRDGLERRRGARGRARLAARAAASASMLFVRIVPNLKRLGLLTPRVRERLRPSSASSSSRTSTPRRRIGSSDSSERDAGVAAPQAPIAHGAAARGDLGGPARRSDTTRVRRDDGAPVAGTRRADPRPSRHPARLRRPRTRLLRGARLPPGRRSLRPDRPDCATSVRLASASCSATGARRAVPATKLFSGRAVADLDRFVRPLDLEAASHRDLGDEPARTRLCRGVRRRRECGVARDARRLSRRVPAPRSRAPVASRPTACSRRAPAASSSRS